MCRLTNLAALALYLTTFVSSQSNARDDGRFANSPLKPWFDRLASGKGLCCSFADGFSVQDVDWDTQDGHYRVRIYGQWFVVPDAAVVTEANRTHKFAVSCLGPARSTKRTCQSLSAMSAFEGKAELVGHLASAHLLEEYPRFLSTNPIPSIIRSWILHRRAWPRGFYPAAAFRSFA